MSFKELGFNDNILKAISDCGYDTPTPIQAEAIPHVLMGRDVVGLAQTGTGKTASFTLPMIEILDGGRAKARMPRSLILSPTRELAAQISENFDTYGKYTGLTKALLVGGTSMAEQIKKLDRGVDVLIATPGRLMDLFERGQILLNDIKVFVIDEADRMLDMGFIPDIEKIAALLPPMRQTLLFSATMPPAINKLTKQFQSNPREVSVSPPASTAEKVEQAITWTSRKEKDAVLHSLIKSENPGAAFIFCNRKKDIDGLCRYLKSNGYDARALHGDMDQKSRTATLALIKEGKVPYLVCSDVAGRGIDVNHVTHVFNYDVPMQADDYVHRIGRTGRAGREGRAFMLAVPKADDKYVDAIEAIIGNKIPVVDVKAGGGAHKSSGDGRSSKPSPKKTTQPSSSKPQSDKPSSADKKQHSKVDQKPEQKPENKKHTPKPQQKKQNNSAGDVKGFGDDIPPFMR